MTAAYLYRNRPPGIGCQPDGFNPDTRKTWLPAKQIDGRNVFGRVEYPEPLAPEQVNRYDLLPENEVELAEMVFWLEGDSAEWLRADYLAADEKMLQDYAERDAKAWAALVIRNAQEA